MNIGDVTNSGFAASKHLKSQRVDHVNDHDSRIAQNVDKHEDKQDPKDSVAISEEARIAHAAEQQKIKDLEFAKNQLEATNELSSHRKQEIMDRLKSGYYTQPDVIDQVATKITETLTGK